MQFLLRMFGRGWILVVLMLYLSSAAAKDIRRRGVDDASSYPGKPAPNPMKEELPDAPVHEDDPSAGKTDQETSRPHMHNDETNSTDDQVNAETASICQTGWLQFSGRCYFFSSWQSSWWNSREQCHNFGAELTSIVDPVENAFIDGFRNGMYTWIGLIQHGDRYVWEDGTFVGYTNWDTGQPDNAECKETCGEMWKTAGKWNDRQCSSDRYFICKM